MTYRIATPLTVASRPDAQVLEVAKIDLKPDFYYKTVPILSPHVYRMADIVNKSEHVLLPGEATMYSGSDFVGQMTLPLVAVGEQFTVGFGVDPQLVVQRSMTDKMRSTSGGNQLLRYEYRILVNSYKAEKVKLQVWDRLPYAENDTVGVSLLKTAPELSKDAIYQREQRPNNLLRWDLVVEPNSHGEKAVPINFEFKLELDRQLIIGGFHDGWRRRYRRHVAGERAAPADHTGRAREDSRNDGETPAGRPQTGGIANLLRDRPGQRSRNDGTDLQGDGEGPAGLPLLQGVRGRSPRPPGRNPAPVPAVDETRFGEEVMFLASGGLTLLCCMAAMSHKPCSCG